jgi:hypothetical protein
VTVVALIAVQLVIALMVYKIQLEVVEMIISDLRITILKFVMTVK